MKYTIPFLFILFLTGCVTKPQITKSESKLILFKTPKIKFYDTGFVKEHANGILMQIYASGQALVEIQSDEEYICMNGGCTSKDSFTQEYLSRYYPSGLFENVLLGRDIFRGKNRTETEEGTQQKIREQDHYDIVYSRSTKVISFKDEVNGIVIRLKSL